MNLINTTNRAAEIMLIEDNLGDVYLTKEAFKCAHFEYNLHVAKDGDEALQMLNKKGNFKSFPKPDLILLDLNLPRIDGRELLEVIKSDIKLKDIPVIVLSGSGTDTDITTSYNLHANSYLVKPDNFDDYKEIITSIENYWFNHKNTAQTTNNTVH